MRFQQGYWKSAEWRGVPLFLHNSLLAWPLLALLYGVGPVMALLSLAAYLVLVAAHEFGHAFIARWRGSYPISIRIHLLHGRCEYEQAWSEFDDVLIAWAGVLAQMVLLAAAFAAQFLLGVFSPASVHAMQPVFFVLIEINCWTALVNLLPIKGLDGGKAWLIIVIALRNLRSRTRQTYAGWARQSRERKAMRTSKAMADDLIKRIKSK
jgi:Zn-dependent protease